MTPEARHAGSSPLTRGKLHQTGIVKRSTGLIPAHAGKTRARRLDGFTGGLIPAHAGKTWKDGESLFLRWAHPRSRGENCVGCEA